MDYNNVNTWRMDQDNRRRATEILIGAPVGNVYHETAYRDTRDASHEEVLARVRIVGVERTAKEYGIKPKVIRRWLKKEGLNNKSMSKDTMKKKTTQEEHVVASQQATVPQEDTRQEDTLQNPAPQTTKKSQDFSPEERKAIVARAKEIGTQKAAEEAGTTRFVVMSWESNDPDYKKFAGMTPAEATPAEGTSTEAAPTETTPVKADPVKSISTEIIPGSDGLPPRKEHVQDYSIEDRLLLIAKAEEVGNGPVSRAYGLSSYTIPNWKRPLTEGRGQIAAPKKSAPKKSAAKKQAVEKQAEVRQAEEKSGKQAAEKKPAEKQTAGKSRKQAAPIALGTHVNLATPQAAQPATPAVPSTPAAPSAPVTPATPVHTPTPAESVVTAAPAVPVAHDTIEMIRLKDRIALLEERIEKLRKVITDLI